MYCKYCGAQIADDSVFCAKCGKHLGQPQAPSPALPATVEPAPKPISLPRVRFSRPKLPKFRLPDLSTLLHRKNRTLFLAIGAAAAVCLLALVLLLMPSAPAGVPVLVTGLADDQGFGHVPLDDGTCTVIRDTVSGSCLTADRKHLVVFYEDGKLAFSDPKLAQSTTISADCQRVQGVCDRGLFYQTTEGEWRRYTFADSTSLTLEDCQEFVSALDGLSCLYATEKEMYLLPEGSDEPVRVGGSDAVGTPWEVSSDGQLGLWSAGTMAETTLYLCEGEEREALESFANLNHTAAACFSQDQKLMVVLDSACESLWLKEPGADTVEARLGAVPASLTAVYTDRGLLSDTSAKEAACLYLAVEGEEGLTLCHITREGDRERILTGIKRYVIAEGHLFYLDMDEALYCVPLKNGELGEKQKISSDASLFDVTPNGQYVCYMRNCSEDSGTLYCWKLGDKEPRKVHSDAACLFQRNLLGNANGIMLTQFSTDGSTLFFLKDTEQIGSSSRGLQGTLMRWDYGGKEPEKVATEVLALSLSSGYADGLVDPENFRYLKYRSVSDSRTYFNWMRYDGKESHKLATDVVQ